MNATDEEYREVARETLAGMREAARHSATLQTDYGKWLTTTIAATHLGGIYVLVSMEGVAPAAKFPAVATLVGGLVLCFASGLFSYLNFGTVRRQMLEWADPRILFDQAAWPKDNPFRRRVVTATMVAAIALGVASVLCLPLATYFMADALGLLPR